MRILLTGACGFIGSHVANRLLADGHEVVGLDNLNAAYDVRLKEHRLRLLKEKANFTFGFCDICDLAGLSEFFTKAGGLDAVIDLAARAGVRQSLEDPWVYLATNATGTLNLLELCRRSGIRKFVLASSSSVYGRSRDLPYSEDAGIGQPLSPYAASKVAAEAVCHSYHYLYGLDISVLRYFTVYGPAGRPDMSPFRFIRWIAEGEPVVIFGDGTQSRDYTFVEDIAEGTIRALRPLGWAVVNLGSDSPVGLLEMASMVEGIVGRKADYEFRPASNADVPATWARIDRARELLGWRPTTKLCEGLEKTVGWYSEHRDMAKAMSLD